MVLIRPSAFGEGFRVVTHVAGDGGGYDPDDRYQSMEEFGQDLTLLLKGRFVEEPDRDVSTLLDDLSSSELPDWSDPAPPAADRSPEPRSCRVGRCL